MTRASRFLVRTGAMAAKETVHVRRDPRTVWLALGMPVLLLVLFGYGVSMDVERVPLAIVDDDRTAESRELARAFTAGHEFVEVADVDVSQVEPLFRRNEALAALVVPRRYAERLARGESGRAQLLVDGGDAATAVRILGKADAIARATSLDLARRTLGPARPPLEARVWTRYNPTERSAIFLVPGLAAYLLAIGAVMLTALTVAGEWERGSMEQLFASPVGRLEIVLGKLLPYLALGFVQLLLVLAVGTAIFDVPVRGSVLLVFVLGGTFLVGMLGQGLLISVVTRNQLVATQAATLSSLLPSVLLSGMIFPIENMPWALRAMSYVIPARYLVHALRGILLKGNGLATLWPDLVGLAAFAAVALALATARFRRRVA
ncbi:MAG TPA: ABC transporter permease [Anaeromyxobacteraceae bacterium]|nr:ABC transporter permease [Anaeromyxobacteraceae bacterium]